MILLALSLMAQVSGASVPPPNEITVTARRLKEWHGRASANAKGSRCRTVRSTGDKQLDQIGCDSMRWCMGDLGPQAATLSEKGITPAVRTQRTEALNLALTTCVDGQHQRRLIALLDARAAARIQ